MTDAASSRDNAAATSNTMMQCLVVIIGLSIACASFFRFWNASERPYKQEMKPVTSFVDSFIEVHGRCLAFHEFATDDHILFDLHVNTEYVRDMGGMEPNDYILGYWAGEWQYCYCSWDGQHYNDYGNEMTEVRAQP